MARKKAEAMKVSENCLFEVKDFYAIDCNNYDYLILMGFMDYVEDARLCTRKRYLFARLRFFLASRFGWNPGLAKKDSIQEKWSVVSILL
jgi:hypothetical protein